jgi:L-amino acid N-acyltransferase YncA
MTVMDLKIRDATTADSEAIALIYNHFVTKTIVTFETAEVAPEEIAQRITTVQSGAYPWLVAQRGESVIGYAYASKWHVRNAFRFSAESSIYLAPEHSGQGIGSILYNKLFERLATTNIHTLIGGIALPNEASVALHEKHGFVKVAHYREVGFKLDRWIDLGYWQRMLR